MLAYQAGAQTTQWFDNNGTSAASDGTWDTVTDTATPNWAGSATLTASTVAFTNGNYAIFAAGSGTTSTMNINVPGQVTCSGLGDGTTSIGGASGSPVTTLTFSGAGSINLPDGVWPFECGNASPTPSITINVPITGTGGIIQHNNGALMLLGTNTYSGGTTFTGGQLLWYNNSNSFGTGPFTVTGSGSIEIAGSPGIVTLTNAFVINNAGGVFNFASGNTTCTGPWTLMTSPQIKNNGASTTVLTISGPISGAFGVYYLCPNAGKIVLSGPNTYPGASFIGYSTGTSPETVSVSSINSVANPPQQPSSSLGVPSSVANGTISIGYSTAGAALIYTGAGETSDRVISLTGTTGGATIEMDGAGPLVLTSNFIVPTNGAKTLTLQGTSTAANTIAGVIPNSASGATSLTKAQAGTWVLSGVNTYTGATKVNTGTLIVGGTGKLPSATALTLGGTLQITSTAGQTLSGVISGAGTFIQAAPNTTTTLTGTANTFTGLFSVTAGIISFNADLSLGAAPGSFVANAITLNGGPLSGLRANAAGITVNANRGITLGANGGEIQVAGNDTCTYNGVISGGGVFQMGQNVSTGLGTLVLGGVETYTGNTIMAAGILRLASGGSIASSSGIIMSNATTFDVSAQSPFALSANNAFFTAVGGATSTTKILGPSGGNVDFGSTPINLSFVPSSVIGDTTNAALTITQGTLLLNGNTINVTNASVLNLIEGTYTLIHQTTGNISVTTPLTFNYYGPALAPHSTASFVVNGGDVDMVVSSTAAQGSFTGTTVQPNGTILLGFTGTPGANYVVQSTTNLAPPIVWKSISTNTAAADGTFQYNDLTSTNFPTQFYRAAP